MKVLLDMELSNRYKEHLEQIVELSHRFGTTDYVRGGGGNTSVKNETVLWGKSSAGNNFWQRGIQPWRNRKKSVTGTERSIGKEAATGIRPN